MKKNNLNTIVNGHPVSNGCQIGPRYEEIDDARLRDLPGDKQDIVMKWIDDNIIPKKNKNTRHTSYGIKHILQADTGIYLTNNQFKDAMLLSGFGPVNYKELNWTFYIAERSPAFRRWRL